MPFQALRVQVIRLPDSAIRLSDGPIRVPQDTDGSIRVLYNGHIRRSVHVEPIRLSDMALPGSQMVFIRVLDDRIRPSKERIKYLYQYIRLSKYPQSTLSSPK